MPLTTAPFLASPKSPILKRLLAKTLDHLLAVNKLSCMYDKFQLADIHGEAFLERALDKMSVHLDGVERLVSAIPKSGPIVIGANHPFGGLEGIILLHAISKVRPDVKVLVNSALALIPQMREWSIFTNPLKSNNPKNGPSLRACKKHLQSGHALLLFPAGRVSYYHKDRRYIADHEWNRVVAKFAKLPNVKYCPVFISGKNSSQFYRLGRIWFRFRLLMLVRELINKTNAKVGLFAQHANTLEKPFNAMPDEEAASFCRALTYIHKPDYIEAWSQVAQQSLMPLAEPVPCELLIQEANSLPQMNQLYSQGSLTAFFASGSEIPNILREITRRRELVFRMHNEGSGQPVDTDHFDMTYTHLFVIDRQTGDIAGAYRMGQTDVLQKQGGLKSLYLSQMFDFKKGFVNQQKPSLEMGRSFLMPQYQKSRLGLFMLWRAIGEFVVRFPQYSTLYGTVSLSKLYDKRSVKLIEKLAVTPTQNVFPHNQFEYTLSPEVQRHLKQYPVSPNHAIEPLDTWLSFIEPDKKKLPVLMRQYAGLGAVFHCLGIDKSFADTPGLLLSVDLTLSSEKKLKQFLGPNYKQIFNG